MKLSPTEVASLPFLLSPFIIIMISITTLLTVQYPLLMVGDIHFKDELRSTIEVLPPQSNRNRIVLRLKHEIYFRIASAFDEKNSVSSIRAPQQNLL